ncbi:MAG: ComEC/Rec2 family competence protein [Flavipsychrobacter sp.]
MKRWPTHEAYFWERAPFFRLLLPIIAGILVYQYSPAIQQSWAWVLLIAGILLFAGFHLFKKRSAAVDIPQFILLNTTLIAAGWLLSFNTDVKQNEHWMGRQEPDAFIARVNKPPAEKDKTWKLDVSVIGNIRDSVVSTSTGKAFVYGYKDERIAGIAEGDTLIIPAAWQPIKNAGNPYEFDYSRYCALNNIYHLQFVSIDKIAKVNTSAGSRSWINEVHEWCTAQLQRYLPDKATEGLMQAMLIGDEVNMDSAMRQAYSETGIIHIVAISGSHILFFFAIISFLLGWIKHRKYHWIKYIVAIPLIWVYVVMAGAPPSAVRSAIMFTILGIGFALEKSNNSLNHLLATAFILLCAQPMWLFAVGFQLSFLAVLSLILFYTPIYKWVNPKNKLLQFIWAAIAASIAAEILVAPLVVYYFHIFPLLFIVANVIAVAFMSIIMIAGMAIITFRALPAIAGFSGIVTTYIVQVFNKMVVVMQGLNPEAMRHLEISLADLGTLFLAIGAAAIFFLKQRKSALFVSFSGISVFLVLLCIDEYGALQQRKLIVYNINKTSYTEIIEGKQYHPLTGDSLNANAEKYILNPAHTGYHAWHLGTIPTQEVWLMNGKTVLLLNGRIPDTSFPVDKVIINYPARPYILKDLFATFKPSEVILPGNMPRKDIPYWISACKAANVRLHAVSIHGAYIL